MAMPRTIARHLEGASVTRDRTESLFLGHVVIREGNRDRFEVLGEGSVVVSIVSTR